MRRLGSSLRQTRLAVLALFGINGWLYASWAARIPEIQSRYAIDDATMGVVLITASLGAFVAMPFAARLNALLGVRRVALLSALLYAATVPLIPQFGTPAVLFSIYAFLGLGFGLLDVAMNTQAVEVEHRYGRAIVSSFHAGFSAAMILGALASSLVIYLDVGLAAHLGGAAALGAAVLAWAYPRLLADEAFAAAASADAEAPAFRLPARATWLIGAIGFCSMMSEASIADWSAKYMLEVAVSREVYAPWALAAFSVAMTLGRVFGDRLRDGLGDARLLRGGAALALAGMAIALALPYPAVVIVGAALVGIGLATAVPIVFSLSGSVPGISASAALAMVTTISYLGLFLGPAVIGFLAEEFGLRAGYGFIAGILAVMVLLAMRVRRAPDPARPPEADSAPVPNTTLVPHRER